MYVILTVFILALVFTRVYMRREKFSGGGKLCASVYFWFFWTLLAIIFCAYACRGEIELQTISRYEKTKIEISSMEIIITAAEAWSDTTYSRTAIQERKNGVNSIILRHRALLKNWYLKDWGLERIAELELLK